MLMMCIQMNENHFNWEGRVNDERRKLGTEIINCAELYDLSMSGVNTGVSFSYFLFLSMSVSQVEKEFTSFLARNDKKKMAIYFES